MRLLRSPLTKLKKRMEDDFVKNYHEEMGFSELEARSLFKDLFSRSERMSKEAKTFDYPMNLGDILLEKEATDREIGASLRKKRREGVTSADVKWWWNRHDVERRFVLEVLQLNRITRIRQFLEDEGLDEREAATRIRQGEAHYGDPEDTEHTSGDDRPLPYELMNRVNSYVAMRMSTDPEKFLIEMSGSSTLNAIIRREIRNGNL